jgi:triosephosphate isomerase
MRRPIVLGNWKMNGSVSGNHGLLKEIAEGWQGEHQAEAVVCPPFPYLDQAMREVGGTSVMVGGQDVSSQDKGAYTGEVSAAMLADIGCRYVIAGHSERRQYHAESDELVASKACKAFEFGLTPVICVGETIEQREAGQTLAVIERQLQPNLARFGADQLAQSVVAYEPLWAIGTGKTATPEQAQEVHAFIRAQLKEVAEKTRIIYGGSVKPDNAKALFAQADIDGALVGGASLKAGDFLSICRAADESGKREV